MPNNALIGALRVEATLDAGKFIDGARRIQAQSKQTEATVKQSFGGMNTAVKAGIAGFVGAFSIGLLTKGVKSALDYASSLKTVAAQLGVTTKFLQEFRFAAGQVGVKQEEADKGLEQFQLNLDKAASGSAKAQKAFMAVGVSIDDIKAGDKPKILGQIADTMAKQGGAAKNAAAGNAIFGEGFSKIIPILNQGSKGMDELRDAADKLGIVLSDSEIQHADETANKLDALQKVLRQEFASTVVANADSIYTLSKALSSLTGEIIRFMNSNPGLAVGIIGALAGSRFGAAGAVVGAAGGVLLGQRMGQNAADANMDVAFRRQQVVNAKKEYLARKAAADNAGQIISFRHGSGGGGTVASAEAELRRQTALLLQAAGAKPQQTGNTPLPQFLAKPPRGGGGGHHRASGGAGPKGPADRSDDVAFQFEREQMQADRDILQAKQQLAGSAEERAAIALKLIDLDHDMQAAEIADRVRRAQRDFAEGRITADALKQVEVQADKLKAANDQKTALEKQAFIEEQLARAEQANFEAADQQRKFTLDALHAADEAATTAADHRRIQLQILDAEIEQRRLELEHQKQLAIRNGATAEEIKVIQDQIDHLPTERAQGAAAVNRNTRNPIEEWAASVPKSAAEINEALQSIEVEGLDGLTDALTGVLTGTESLKDAFHQLAASILADLLKMTIKMLLFKALESAIGGFSGGSGATYDNSVAIGNMGLPGFATGGSFSILGNKGTDRNTLSLNGLPIARVSHGERVSIGNDNYSETMGRPVVINTFEMHSPVVTEDLLRQMDAKADQAAQAGAKLGVSKMVDLNRRTFGKALSSK